MGGTVPFQGLSAGSEAVGFEPGTSIIIGEVGDVGIGIISGIGSARAAAKAASLRVVAPSGSTFGRRLPGTQVDLNGDVLLYTGRQQARAQALAKEAAEASGIDLSRYVDDVVVVSRNEYGDAITPWFDVINGRRTLALTPQTLSRSRAGQLIDTAHELGHARHSRRLGHSRYKQLYNDPLQQARSEILVQDRAIKTVERHLGGINRRVLNRERAYIDDWTRVFFEESFKYTD